MLLTDHHIEDVFYAAFHELKENFFCTYVSYLYQYKNFKLNFVTHQDWLELYINRSMNKKCPLIRVGLEKIASSRTSSVLLRWNDVLPITKEEKNTVGIRSEFNICNGISFGRQIFGVSDYFGLASDGKNYDFPKHIISNARQIRIIMDNLFKASTVKLFYDSITSAAPLSTKLFLGVVNSMKV